MRVIDDVWVRPMVGWGAERGATLSPERDFRGDAELPFLRRALSVSDTSTYAFVGPATIETSRIGSAASAGSQVFAPQGDFALAAAAAPGQAMRKGIVVAQSADPRAIANCGIFTPSYVPSDNLYSSQWHLTDPNLGINVQNLWDQYTGAGVSVGVYDEGIQSNHHDLNGNYDASAHVEIFDTINNGGVCDAFYDIHATAVAGLIAAENDGVGTVGVAFNADVTGVQIFWGGWSYYIPELMAQQYTFDVTNHSWGYTNFYADNRTTSDGGYWDILFDGIQYAADYGRGGLGTIMLHAAANGRVSTDDVNLHGMKNDRHNITVAAMANDGFVSYYSTPGTAILITAPSSGGTSGIVTTDRLGVFGYESGDYTSSFGGTSAATPIVSGVVALMLEANPSLGWRDVQAILAATARHVGSSLSGGLSGSESYGWTINNAGEWNGGGYHYSGDYGFGLVDAWAAVRLAETWNRQATSWTEWSHTTSTTGSWLIDDINSASIDLALSAPSVEVDVIEVTLTWSTPHTWMGDLDITLTSPDGTVYWLIHDAGDNGVDTPTSWTFMTRAYLGENPAGTWTLSILDDFASDSGVLSGVTLTAWGSYTSAGDEAANNIYVFTNEYAAMVALQAGRATLVDVDGTGTDTLNFSACSGSSVIDMLPGGACTIAGQAATIGVGQIFEIAYGGEGNDTISGNNVNNWLYGGRGNDSLYGRDGDDYLDGNSGADNMYGGNGNDTYIVTTSADQTIEVAGATGVDIVFSSVTRTLGDRLENLTLTGSANTWGTGNNLNNIITGNSGNNTIRGEGGADTLYGGDGNDTLDGGSGVDTMYGGAGDDTYVVTTSTDVTTEISNGDGVDTVLSSVTRQLGSFLENLTLTGSGNIWGTGNTLNNVLLGNSGDNRLNGGAGNDTLNGGLGADLMIGGTGADSFVFDAAIGAGNIDRVTDFSVVDDTIVLEDAIFAALGGTGALSSSAFRIGSAAADADDRIIYNSATGALFYDADGNGAGLAVQFATLSTGLALTSSDFFVI